MAIIKWLKTFKSFFICLTESTKHARQAYDCVHVCHNVSASCSVYKQIKHVNHMTVSAWLWTPDPNFIMNILTQSACQACGQLDWSTHNDFQLVKQGPTYYTHCDLPLPLWFVVPSTSFMSKQFIVNLPVKTSSSSCNTSLVKFQTLIHLSCAQYFPRTMQLFWKTVKMCTQLCWELPVKWYATVRNLLVITSGHWVWVLVLDHGCIRVGNSSLLGHCPFGLDVNLIFKGTEASWEGTKATFHPSPGAPRPV